MTASQSDTVRSDNSVSRNDREAGAVASENDPRTHRIVQYPEQQEEPITRNEIAAKTGWLLEDVDDYLEWFRKGNYVQLLEEHRTTVVLLTSRGEALAEGAV